MENNYINLKQERDFGEVFSTGIAFIKQEYKQLGMAILYFVVPVLLVASIFLVILTTKQQAMIGDISGSNDNYMNNPFSYMSDIFGYVILIGLLYATAITSLKCTIYGYVKLYVEKGKDGFSLNDVWDEILRYFLPVFGVSILVGLIIAVGFMFCVIPGIYLGTSLCLIFIALIYEGKGFSNAFSRSFELTKQDWWITLVLLIVTYLMIYIITLVFSVPSILLGLKPMLSNLKNLEDPSEFTLPTAYYIVNSIIY